MPVKRSSGKRDFRFFRQSRRLGFRTSAVESRGRVQSVTSKRQLRQFQIESVKFVGTQVTDEESGAVGGNVAPGASCTTLESGQGLQIEQTLRASFADLAPLKGGMLAERNVVVKVAPVGGPVRKAETSRFRD